jgi:hypothetical protein
LQITGTSLTQLHVNNTRNKDFIQVFCHKVKQRAKKQQYKRKLEKIAQKRARGREGWGGAIGKGKGRGGAGREGWVGWPEREGERWKGRGGWKCRVRVFII